MELKNEGDFEEHKDSFYDSNALGRKQKRFICLDLISITLVLDFVRRMGESETLN